MKLSLLEPISLYIFLGLLAYMPLHILASTWIGTSFHVLALAKVAKDGVLVVGFVCVFLASVHQPWFYKLLKDKLVWLILAFGLLNVILAVFRPADQDAETLGLVYNTRFFLFFIYAILLGSIYEARYLRREAVKIVMAIGAIVLFFGIIQYTILPDDALSRLGYARQNGVLPAFFIDEKPDLERVMSTLRDPNSLGSYIIIIGSLALSYLIRSRNLQVRKITIWLSALSILCLWFTFSRSAWLGFVLSVFVLGIFWAKNQKLTESTRRRLILGAGTLSIVGLLGLLALRNTYFVQNVIFHADKSTVLEDPNQLRIRFWKESVRDLARNPMGHGPGTAGLASIRNDKQGVTLNENYYLQMAHELGILGLLIFLTILGTVGWRLSGLSVSDTLALGLFASFIGLALTNFLVHIWANEAVAYTWWGLAGLVLSNYILGKDKT